LGAIKALVYVQINQEAVERRFGSFFRFPDALGFADNGIVSHTELMKPEPIALASGFDFEQFA
jgi:hypothetical protein